MKEEMRDFLIVCLYIDGPIYMGTNMTMVEEFKKIIMEEFEMLDLGLMRYFLRVQVKQSNGDIFISQETYINDLLIKFYMEKYKPSTTPLSLNENLQQKWQCRKNWSKII